MPPSGFIFQTDRSAPPFSLEVLGCVFVSTMDLLAVYIRPSPDKQHAYTGSSYDLCKTNLEDFWFKYDLGQKYYAPQVRPDLGSNSWSPDYDSTLHVTEMPALTTRPSGTSVSPEEFWLILPLLPQREGDLIIKATKNLLLTLKVLNFWKFPSYCSLKPLRSGMGEVVLARTSLTLHPPSPPTVHQLSWLAL